MTDHHERTQPSPAPLPQASEQRSEIEALLEENTTLLRDIAAQEELTRQTREQIAALQKQLSDAQHRADTLFEKIELETGVRENLGEVVHVSLMMTRFCHKISTLEQEEIVDAAVNRLPLIIGARHAALFFHDYSRNVLKLEKHSFPEEIREEIPLLEPSFARIRDILKGKETVLVNEPVDFDRLRRLLYSQEPHKSPATRSAIIAPLTAHSHNVGMLALFEKKNGEGFDEKSDVPPVQQLADMVAAAIRNFQLYAEVQGRARTDGLTGLANHSAFYEHLSRETRRAFRYNNPLCLLMIDLDNFKHINDAYGHGAGDEVLRQIAAIILASTREVDIAARYGGDEFSVILPQTDREGAMTVANRILNGVRLQEFKYKDQVLQITASIGATLLKLGMKNQNLFDMADKALYAAKDKGKNAVHFEE